MARLYDFDPYEGDLPNDVVAPVDRADFPAVVPATPAQLAKLLLSMPAPEGGFPDGSLGDLLLAGGGVSVKDFGAVGDGVADDTAALQAAVNGASLVEVPAGFVCRITAPVTVPSGVTLSGAPGATLTAGVNDINILELAGTDIVIEDLAFVCPATVNPSLFFSNTKPGGAAVAINGGSRVQLRRLDVRNHVAWGVYFRNATDCAIDDSYIHNGALPTTPHHDECVADIGVIASATRIAVRRNRCYGGLHTGVYCQTSSSATPSTQDDVEVSFNRIKDAGGYGILAYNNTPASDVMKNFVFHRNVVSNITGAIPFNNSGSDLFQYGPGIYAVNVDSIDVTANIVRNCLASNVDETLGAGAITINDCVAPNVSGNRVRDSAKHGITIRNANRSTMATLASITSNNIVKGCTKEGIRLVRLQHFTVAGNTATENHNGLEMLGDPTVPTQYGAISGNLLSNNTNDGFYADTSTVQYITYNGNHTIANGRYGVYWERGVTCIVQGNTSVSNVSRQYNVSSSCTFRSWSKNTGAGAADYVNNGIFPESVSVNPATTGAITLTETSARTLIWTSALTGNITFTGPTVSSNNLPLGEDAIFIFVRTAAATGAFTLTFNGVSIAAGERMVHMVTASGVLTCIEKTTGVP